VTDLVSNCVSLSQFVCNAWFHFNQHGLCRNKYLSMFLINFKGRSRRLAQKSVGVTKSCPVAAKMHFGKFNVAILQDVRFAIHRLRVRVLTGHHCIVASYLHHCASVIKQYNLVSAKGWLCSMAGNVIMLALHWPCTTDLVVYPPEGSCLKEGR